MPVGLRVGYRLQASLGVTTAPASAATTPDRDFGDFNSGPPFRFPRESAFGRFNILCKQCLCSHCRRKQAQSRTLGTWTRDFQNCSCGLWGSGSENCGRSRAIHKKALPTNAAYTEPSWGPSNAVRATSVSRTSPRWRRPSVCRCRRCFAILRTGLKTWPRDWQGRQSENRRDAPLQKS